MIIPVQYMTEQFVELGLKNTYLDQHSPLIYNRSKYYVRYLTQGLLSVVIHKPTMSSIQLNVTKKKIAVFLSSFC